MGGTYFKLDVTGLAKSIDKGVHQIGKTKELMETIGEVLVSGAKERFEDEKAPDGTAWVKGKKKSGKTLSGQTGNLKKSITVNAGISEVVYGSNLEYAAIHQFGGTPELAHNKTMPARPFIGISEEDDKEIKHMMALFMQDAFNGSK